MTNADVVFSEADPSCCGELARLSGICFPASMRWVRWSGYGERWWRHAMDAQGAHALTVRDEHSGELIGFQLLIVDDTGFPEHLRKVRPSPWDRFLAAPYAPIARRRKREQRAKADELEPKPAWPAERQDGSPRPRAWSEMTGVHPKCRGRGVARVLLENADRIAAESGMKSIETMTDIWNSSAIRMREKSGYRVVQCRNGKIIMSKPVSIAAKPE